MQTLRPLTNNQIKRVESEITEMQTKLDKQMAYSNDLRDYKRISEIATHITNLQNMIKNGWKAPSFN
jgi:cell division protein FtsL